MATTGDVVRASSMLLHGELNVADTELKVPTGSIPLESTVIQMPPDPHADGPLKDDNNEATVSSQDPNVINQETDALLGASRLEGQKQSELLSEAEVRNIMWIKMGPEGLKGVDGDKKHVLYKVALEHWEAKATVIQMPPDSQDPGVINQETSHQGTDALLGASTPECHLLSEAEIRNIMWMKMGPEGLKGVDGDKKHVLYKVALEHWEAKDKLFTTRVEKKKKQSLSVRNEIYQLIGFYSVFQGVLLTAVAQSNLLHCNNWWSVFTLSALASFVTVFGVKQKFDTILELEETIGTEEISRKQIVNWLSKLKSYGSRFDFKEHAQDGKDKKGSSSRRNGKRLKFSIIAVIVVLILFSCTFLVAIRQILCNPGYSLLPGNS